MQTNHRSKICPQTLPLSQTFTKHYPKKGSTNSKSNTRKHEQCCKARNKCGKTCCVLSAVQLCLVLALRTAR